MKHNGYVISRNKAKKEFFISSSSYDVPSWVPVKEATSYPTAELADAAKKKLLRYGAYEARILSLAEAMEFEFPEKEPNKTIGNIDDQDEMNDQMNGELGDDDDEMTAQHQGEPCPECGNTPCTCQDHDQDEDNDVENDVDVIISRGGEVKHPGEEMEPESEMEPEEEEKAWSPKRFLRNQPVMLNGKKHIVVNDPGTGVAIVKPADGSGKPVQVQNVHLIPVTEAFKMPGKPPLDSKPSENKKTVMDLKPSPATKYTDPAEVYDKPDTDLTTTGAEPNEEKIKVPKEVMTELKAAIDSYEKQAELANTRDDAKASFCMTTAEAFKTLMVYLEIGTVESMKAAQLQVASWMSPIVNNLPVPVQKFVYMAGRKPSLKDIFDVKWEEKRS